MAKDQNCHSRLCSSKWKGRGLNETKWRHISSSAKCEFWTQRPQSPVQLCGSMFLRLSQELLKVNCGGLQWVSSHLQHLIFLFNRAEWVAQGICFRGEERCRRIWKLLRLPITYSFSSLTWKLRYRTRFYVVLKEAPGRTLANWPFLRF